MSTVSLADAKAHLNIGVNTYDVELQAFIDAAEAVIAQRVGPLAATSVTARVRGGNAELVLPVLPALSITSVTPVGGTALTASTLYLDTGSALVTYVSGSPFASKSYDVVYQAGRTTLPADLRMAVLELVRHLWQTQRGSGTRPGGPLSDTAANTVPGAAYLLPFRVEALIAPHEIMAGFA